MNPFFTSHLGFNELQAASDAQPLVLGREQEIYRYRKQRGVNLGSWFVQERWICEDTFRYAESPRQSDLDIARGTNAKEVLEGHWDTWIEEEDWRWLRERGFNSVRIPVSSEDVFVMGWGDNLGRSGFITCVEWIRLFSRERIFEVIATCLVVRGRG